MLATSFRRIALGGAAAGRRLSPLLVLQKQQKQQSRPLSGSSDSHDDFKPKQKKAMPEGAEAVHSLIDLQVKENDVMLYMKGTPSAPQCGFSSQAVRILNAVGVDFSSINILEYPALRDGVKVYSQWPTFPQLYVKGEFVGGCDIMTSMFTDGELEKLMKEKKVLE